jgi:hypothetical protein
MILDPKTAISTLCAMANTISDELEFYQGSKGMTDEMEEGILQFKDSVDELQSGLASLPDILK